jgi:hypothetical protein
MLHFGCGIAFSMDIGYFLEFQCSFQRNREINPTPKIEEIF